MKVNEKSIIEDYHQNICVIPFIHLASRADGAVQLCCRSLKTLKESSGKPLSLGYHSLDEVWNGREMRAVRLSMLRGKKLSECRNCWDEEKNGKCSKRVRENNRFLQFSRLRLQEAKNNDGALSSAPSYIELKSGNVCNLKCRTCNPLASSLWRTELKHYEDKWLQIPVLKNTYQDSFHLSKQMTNWHETDVFFQTVKEMNQDLKYISITGGEPVLIKSNLRIMDYFLKTGTYKNITLQINSNMTLWKASFFQRISQFKQVDFFASVDALGKQNDWIRSPSHFSKIEKNIKKLLQLSGNIKVHIICTVSIYNIFYIDELIKWSRQLAKEFKVSAPPVYFNILHQPEFQHISVLTQSLKEQIIDRCKGIIDGNKNLYKQETEGINYVISALQSSLEDTEQTKNLRALLKKHTESLDNWRKESFSAVFPELVGLWH